MANIKDSFSKDDLFRIILSLLLLILGILFCFAKALGENIISIILGIGFIIGGAVFVGLAAFGEKKLLSGNAIVGYLFISVGLLFIVNKALTFFMAIVPYLLLTFGSGILVDSFLGIILKRDKAFLSVIKFLVGAILITLGILILCVDKVAEWQTLMVGIAFILFAVVLIFTVIIKKRKNA